MQTVDIVLSQKQINRLTQATISEATIETIAGSAGRVVTITLDEVDECLAGLQFAGAQDTGLFAMLSDLDYSSVNDLSA